MSRERPLQQLPCLSEQLDGSMLSQNKPMKMLDKENTPQELIQCWSPPHKLPRISARGKENDFVLGRRPRRRKEPTGLSWDQLPDELLLGIFYCLSLRDLLDMARVCRRWCRLAFDESLWNSVDLLDVVRLDAALSQVLPAGVLTLRCPRSCIGEPRLARAPSLRVQRMDLSSCIVSPSVLGDIMSRCCHLQDLSLEGLELSDGILLSLAQNRDLVRLNLSGCSGVSPQPLGDMIRACTRMEELNVSWCDFSSEHVKSVISNIAADIAQLDISGYRQNLTMEDVKVLVERCPKLTHLDLSDSVLVTPESFQFLRSLASLRHLGLSRCYQIHPAALAELEKLPALRTLEVFGLVQESYLPVLIKALPRLLINTRCFSTVARPTPVDCRDGAVWGVRCRLSYRS
ncbi:S-phase kinase-associated protein 2 isoform X1 [Brienomyrus brachyistius]|uniref:S-phase kinase-associated protein 2 isoform X1 n=1 Tax=Brienomyrus brachyistius TaxID=42636 RepID=UPI0020B2AD6C|nr:S-phase kinase-associated protein 2 isoform X1 [Brienomyrus brachyistius]